jgi:PAS domain S-box-containing protein
MEQLKASSAKTLSNIVGYAIAVLSFSFALAMGLLLRSYTQRDVEFPLFLFAIAITVWYTGPGPAILSLVLSALAFDFFFTEPYYNLSITSSDIPYYVLFLAFASLITAFTRVRRGVERELRQARDKLQAEVEVRTRQASLLNLTHDTIFVRDMADNITYWNRGAQELYGWTDEQAIGKQTIELLRTQFPKPFEEIREELLLADRWEGELRNTKADGTEVIVSSRWSLQRNEQQQPVAVLETNNDITDRKRIEEEIRELNKDLQKRTVELEAVNKELEAFAYSTSHDLRAPLRHMAGYAELLQKNAFSSLDEKSRRYMTMIRESAKRMGTLIDDLLTFSRLGRTETKKARVSLDELVADAVNDIRQETDGRNIVWKIATLPEVYGDPSMFKVVLVNLISNAVKFTRTRSQAEIEIGQSGGTSVEVIVFIRDNGVGFNMKYVNKLFGVFQRLHRSETFEGTGIGLATVQRIIHRHGGRVWAEGLVDGGATFYFSAPKSRSVKLG